MSVWSLHLRDLEKLPHEPLEVGNDEVSQLNSDVTLIQDEGQSCD